ncbi:transmembrane protein 248 [Pitangus sulphuratus]|nr:transmembrane protein 248 [Pitangus sulphuratus]
MFYINLLENLKVYISSRPPLVVFMISVSAMAIAFLTLGYFFKIKEIKSPEMTEDWNTFLLRFNDLDFCISENETLKHLINDTTTPESTVTSGQARSSTQSPQALEDSGPINISVTITLTLDPLRPFGGYSRNVTHLSSTIFGHQIGLSEPFTCLLEELFPALRVAKSLQVYPDGALQFEMINLMALEVKILDDFKGRESHEEINITFTLPAAWNSDDCVLHGHCEQVVFTTCMTVTAASNVFPVTVQPPHCVPETYSNATLWYKIFTTARDSNTKYAQDYNPFWCYKGAIGKVYHALNPKLTVIVPDDDRSLINLHLMHTSYFLFVMVITMFCYAVIKGRPSKLRQSNTEFCSEKVALSEA